MISHAVSTFLSHFWEGTESTPMGDLELRAPSPMLMSGFTYGWIVLALPFARVSLRL
jgi:hypothetical protein